MSDLLRQRFGPEVQAAFARYPAGREKSAALPLLYLAQAAYGYLSTEAIEEVARLIGVDSTHVRGLAGFYSLFLEQPHGGYVVQYCNDLPCALRGAEKFGDALCAKLGVKWHGTTADGEFTLEPVMCLAACDKAPMFQIQDADGLHYHESESAEKPMTVEQALAVLESYKSKK